jgi:hypothetical protein
MATDHVNSFLAKNDGEPNTQSKRDSMSAFVESVSFSSTSTVRCYSNTLNKMHNGVLVYMHHHRTAFQQSDTREVKADNDQQTTTGK